MRSRTVQRAAALPWGAVFLGVTVLATAARPCLAQLRAQVMPARDAVTARPAVPVVREVVIRNHGDASVVVRVRLSDFTVDEQGEMHLLPPGTVPGTLSGCIRFEPATFSLPAGESGRIQVTLTLPLDGPPTRWGLLLSEVRPATPRPVELGPRAIAELGTTFYLSRVSPENAEPEIIGLKVAPSGRDSIAFTVRVRNAGERQFHVMGELALADSTGGSTLAGRLPAGVVLPGNERDFTWTANARLAPGTYHAMATLDTGQPELLVGETRLSWPGPPPPALALRP